MKTISDQIDDSEMEEFVEVDTFTSSFSPINRTEKFIFGLRDRICCVSVLATFFAIVRLLLSK